MFDNNKGSAVWLGFRSFGVNASVDTFKNNIPILHAVQKSKASDCQVIEKGNAISFWLGWHCIISSRANTVDNTNKYYMWTDAVRG